MTCCSRLLLAAITGLLSINCDDSCQPGYAIKSHVCFAIGSTGGSGNTAVPDAGTGADAGTHDDAGNIDDSTCTDSSFGKTCMSAADCGCDTAFCAGYPGQQGLCSHTGCLQDPTVCPADWPCQDFSAYQAGLSLCTPP